MATEEGALLISQPPATQVAGWWMLTAPEEPICGIPPPLSPGSYCLLCAAVGIMTTSSGYWEDEMGIK